jgi:4-amino-4-deoxy-L-arabinose transferase-like glycosyltransferase
VKTPRTDWLLLVGFCGFLFFFGLTYLCLVGADEPRYAQVAREMLARHDWITPTLGGKPWLEKPPLYYWQAMLAYGLLGVSDWAARLPSAVDATLMVVAIYFFLKRLRPGVQLDGALIAASAAGVIGFARAASTDMPLASMFTIALLAWYAWSESGKQLYLTVFYAFLALGSLAKGPVAPFLAAVIIALFAAAKRDYRLVLRTLWIPGILLFCAIALPWYVAVQIKNPDFFRIFIFAHNLARFGTNLYHHREPFWYYLPVTLLALVPWTVFIAASVVETMRAWWSERKALFGASFKTASGEGTASAAPIDSREDKASAAPLDSYQGTASAVPSPAASQSSGFSRWGGQTDPASSEDALNMFLVIWLLVPVLFFSISQSKLPGYILPALPAGALLLADYLRRRLADDEKPNLVLTILHAVVAAAPIVPAVMIQYIVLQHRLPWGKAAAVSITFAALVAVAVAFTLRTHLGLRMLRFVTLVPVVLAVAAILRLGSPVLDSTLSVRPLAAELSRLESRPLPLAVARVSRQTEYGLAFYRNQVIERYESGQIPAEEHLLVAPESSQTAIAREVPGRRVSYLGSFAPQGLDYYWVAPAGSAERVH